MVTRGTRKVVRRKITVTKKTATTSSKKKTVICPNTYNEYVQTRAYHLWEESGYQNGTDVDHWVKAERDISTKFSIK
ncbi:MAG: DUF2934 domain-containing protein [Candidatus Omnitrophota bacterium]